MSEKSELLKRKTIVLRLIGGPGNFMSYPQDPDYEMPYLSGSQICSIADNLGKKDLVYEFENLSRELYFDELIDYCDKNNKIADLINYLFSKRNFMSILQNIDYDQISIEYNRRKKRTLSQLNASIWDTEYKFIEIGNKVILANDVHNNIDIPILENNKNEVEVLYKSAQEEILIGHYSTALIKAETMIDKTLRYGANKKHKKFGERVSFKEKYKRIAEWYNIKISSDLDKRVVKLISGMNTTVDSIAEMRNHDSSAHSHDYPLNVKDYHVRFAINCSISICEFLFSIYDASKD